MSNEQTRIIKEWEALQAQIREHDAKASYHAKLAAGGGGDGDDLTVGGDLLAAVHLHLTALVDALPALRAEFRHDPAGSAVVAKLQAAVVPAVQYVGAKMTAEG